MSGLAEVRILREAVSGGKRAGLVAELISRLSGHRPLRELVSRSFGSRIERRGDLANL